MFKQCNPLLPPGVLNKMYKLHDLHRTVKMKYIGFYIGFDNCKCEAAKSHIDVSGMQHIHANIEV